VKKLKTLMMKKITFYFAALCIFFACTNEPKKENTSKTETPQTELSENDLKLKSLEKEIMAAHDEAMPLMNKTEDLEKKLKSQLEKAKNKEEKSKILDKLSKLHAAEKAMFKWMDEYRSDLSEVNKVQQLIYLESERDKVVAMAKMVKAAYAEAGE
jgi:predicted transcriptional regulator